MTNREKAEIILKYLDGSICVNWPFEEIYLKAIIRGLKEIEKEEQA